MKRLLFLSLAALTISGLAQADGINLVTNGSFEEGAGGIGSFDGWQTVLGDAATFVDSTGETGIHPNQASDGLWSAYFGSTNDSGGSLIFQILPTIIGRSYLLSFDVANDNGDLPPSNAFVAALDGNPVFFAVNLPEQDYTRKQIQFVAAGNGTELRFAAFNDQSYVQLDRVSVSAVPEPATLVLLLLAALPMGRVVTRRRAAL